MAEPEGSPRRSSDYEDDEFAAETSGLLANHERDPYEDEGNETGDVDDAPPPSRSNKWFTLPPWLKRSSASQSKPSRRCRWPSLIAILILAIIVVVVMVLGFMVPPAVKTYAENAAVVEPTGLSIESITSDGVRARVQASFRLDGSRVEDANSRRIGRLATGIMRKLETKKTKVSVRLPRYDNALLGEADVPPLTIDIRDGHSTQLDFVTDLNPGDAEHIRKIANDWLDGKLDQLKVTGSAVVHLKSGVFPLGSHDVVESLVFEANKIPSMPAYDIQRLNFHDAPVGPDGDKAVQADVSVSVHNDYPIAVAIPSLGFEILVANCDPTQPCIVVADAVTAPVSVQPKEDVVANARGIIRTIPDNLVRTCPKTQDSPLDKFMEHYLHGEDARVYVRGTGIEGVETPEWLAAILSSITVPLEMPSGSFGDLIRNFSLDDIDFSLPSPFGDPNDPESQARVSGTVNVLAALPPEMNVDLAVKSIRSDADLYFEGDKLGELNLKRWEKTNSTKLVVDDENMLNITAKVVDVPLNVTDGDVFGDVMQRMLFGSTEVLLDVEAAVDVKISTVLGNLVVKRVPAKGKVPVKTLPGNNLIEALKPRVNDLAVLNTSDTGMRMHGTFNMTNPTPYTATIPHLNLHVYEHGTMIAEAIVQDLDLRKGDISGISAIANWDPEQYGGAKGRAAAKSLLSNYISGKNATITFKAHRGSVPNMPVVGEAMSRINFTLPAPRMNLPGEEGDDPEHQSFIRDATFHLFSSTANFVLASPLRQNTIYIDYINATALYNHTEPIGTVVYDKPFAAPPGLSDTPRLPVHWSASSVGYDKLKDAVGGSLKLDAVANVTIRIGNWRQDVIYEGRGIGAKVRL